MSHCGFHFFQPQASTGQERPSAVAGAAFLDGPRAMTLSLAGLARSSWPDTA